VLELRHFRCNITAIQETRWIGDCVMDVNGFRVFLSSNKRQRTRGTGFIVDPKWNDRVIDWNPVSDRVCVIRIKGRFFNLSLINVYAPTNDRPEDEKDSFYSLLERTYDQCPRNDIKIVLGDLNAQVGREKTFRPTIGPHSLHPRSNENGLRLITFAAAMNMRISSTYFQRKNTHKATWNPPGGGRKCQIDHVLIDSRHASNILNVRSFKCTQLDIEHHDSDHFAVGAKIRFRVSNIGRIRSVKAVKYDVNKLKNEETKSLYNESLEQQLAGRNLEQVSWQECRDIMKNSAEFCLGLAEPVKNEWFDEECKEAVQRIIDVRKMRMTRAREEVIRQLQRDKKVLLRNKKRKFDQRCLEEIEELQSMNESRKYFNAIKFAQKKFYPRVAIVRSKDGDLMCSRLDVLRTWKDHFNEALNVGSLDEEHRAATPYMRSDGKIFPEPTLEEITEAIGKLKNNKAPGEDGLPSELFKTGCDELYMAIHSIIKRIWSEEKLPEEWTVGVICPLHKKGCKLTCSNFRGITLLNSAYKILSKILSARLEPHYEEFLHEYQAGFRKGRSTIDQIQSIRQIIQKSDDRNVETLHLLIDFRVAYYSVNREELWSLMAEYNFPHKMIRLLRATLAKVQSCVKVQGFFSEKFETRTGLKQGDELSTKLFNIALEGICRRAKLQLTGTIFNKSSQLLAFADDIDIVGRSLRAITDTFSKLEREANKVGLHVNEEKTKLLMVAASTRTKQQVGTHLCINNKRFEVVEEFKYLGSFVNSSSDVTLEVRKRIHSGYGAFYSLKHLLSSKSLSRGTKKRMYKTLIRVVALYGSESWNTTLADEEALGVFERRVLRTIYGPVKEEGEYRSRFNKELYDLYQEPDIATVLRVNRLRWAGHVIRRPIDAPVQKVTTSDFTEGKRSRGRPKSDWSGCVENDAKKLRICNWQRAAKDRTSFRKLLNAAMGPRVPSPRK